MLWYIVCSILENYVRFALLYSVSTRLFDVLPVSMWEFRVTQWAAGPDPAPESALAC